MNVFQLIVLPILAILFIERVVAIFRGHGSRRMAAFWALVWLAAGIGVARPGLTTTVGHLVGTGRGADFVLYCAVLFMFVGFFMVYVRIRRLESDLTRLVRHIAIKDPIRPVSEAAAGEAKKERAQ
jgi:hypothetical protein